MGNMALLLQVKAKLLEAESLFRSVLEDYTKVLGPDHPDTLTLMNNLASLLKTQGKQSEAEPLYKRALKVRTKVLGPDHPDTLLSMYNYVSILLLLGKKEAVSWSRICVQRNEKVFGLDKQETKDARDQLRMALSQQKLK